MTAQRPAAAPPLDPARVNAQRSALLAWYDAEGRALPWRVRPQERARGERPDPYRVWLSEIMLQQTTVAAASPYYARFLDRFPDVFALASAPRDDVLSLWAGLGYYARARNLHACAQVVAQAGGRFPDTEAGLRALPGVGAYTAAAIAAVCFDAPANVVDANVERVMARVFAVDAPVPGARKTLAAHAASLVGSDRPGDYAQALMDLGATLCRPKKPECPRCPWSGWCAANAQDAPTRYPVKAPKAKKPVRHGYAFVLIADGAVWLRRRPERGLLGAKAEPPGAPWREGEAWSLTHALVHAPIRGDWRGAACVRHVFSHFALELRVAVWRPAERPALDGGWWAPTRALDDEALPSVMRRAVEAALAGVYAPEATSSA